MKINKSEILNYLQKSNLIYKIEKDYEIIYEENNRYKNGRLKELKINFNIESDFWMIKSEKFKDIYYNNFKKTEVIILNFRNNFLDIIMIEMKSYKFEYDGIKTKFEKSFSWFLSLLCLFNHQDRDLKVFGIIANQNEKDSKNLTSKDLLAFFENDVIPITIKPFISESEKIEININEIYKR